MFDTFGVLNGVVPVKEIEDEYITEVINNIDVNKVFEKVNSDYYCFKKEIMS